MKENQQSLLAGAGLLAISAVLALASGIEWLDARWDLQHAEQLLREETILTGDTYSAERASPLPALQAPAVDSSLVSRVVNRISAHAGVKIVSSRDAPPVGHKRLSEFPTEIVAEGDFAALVGMLDEIEASTPNICVRSAEFRSAQNENSVSLTAILSLLAPRAPSRLSNNPVFSGQNAQPRAAIERDDVLFRRSP